MKLDHSVPPVYSVGPVVDLNSKTGLIKEQENEINEWLDSHPQAYVAFLCFGSRGAFQPAQVKEMERGLESSGCRFLWALRHPSSSELMKLPLPEDYENFSEVMPLPEGFFGTNSRDREGDQLGISDSRARPLIRGWIRFALRLELNIGISLVWCAYCNLASVC